MSWSCTNLELSLMRVSKFHNSSYSDLNWFFWFLVKEASTNQKAPRKVSIKSENPTWLDNSEGFSLTLFARNRCTSVDVSQTSRWRFRGIYQSTKEAFHSLFQMLSCVWKHWEIEKEGKERHLWLQRYNPPMASNPWLISKSEVWAEWTATSGQQTQGVPSSQNTMQWLPNMPNSWEGEIQRTWRAKLITQIPLYSKSQSTRTSEKGLYLCPTKTFKAKRDMIERKSRF